MQFFFFVLGSIFGSFLGVIIDRLPAKRSIVYGRSECDYCEAFLRPQDLIPVVSFIKNKGSCARCKEVLSPRYLYLELLSGFLFLLAFRQFSISFDLLIALIFTSLLIVIAFIDIDTMLIYDKMHFFILALGLIRLMNDPSNLKNQILGALIVSLPYLILAILTQGIGGGDVKLSFSVGFFLGVPNVIVGFILAILLGGLHGIYLLKHKGLDLKTAIPFGPYLCIGFFTALLYGSSIAKWYLNFLI